jgi:plastocyanin
MQKIQTIVTTVLLASLAACGGGYGSSTGSGGGDGSPAGSVRVGPDIAFVSRHTGKVPALDTIAVGATATWTWTGGLAHSVRSIGTLTFANSGTKTGSGSHSVQFNTPGTYRYDCTEHGAAMSGTVVVLP